MTTRRTFLSAGAAAAASLAGGCAVFDRRGWRSIIVDAYGGGAQPLPPLAPGDGARIDEPWFIDFLAEFVAHDPANAMEGKFAGEPIFKSSLVGFARGTDNLFEDYKEIIGPFHQTPAEVMAWAAAEQGVEAPPPDRIAVVSFVLPFADQIVADNAGQKRWCSARWAQGRLFGEIFCQQLSMALLIGLAEQGVLAVAPDLMPNFRKDRYPGVGWASPWSHRHFAFAAGLGSFGMNDFFISEQGSAHRCGSLVVAKPLAPNRERPPHYRHACLHHRTGGCLACAQRCPVKAIGENGHDKDKCSRNVLASIPRNQTVNQVNIYGCGLCATGTPCSQASPG